MKTLYKLRSILTIASLLFFSMSSNANWMNSEKPANNDQFSQNMVESNSGPKQTPGDTLPKGVTKDWLNSLTDENGNRIIPDNQTGSKQEDPEGDAMQRKVFNGLAAGGNFGYSVGTAGDVNGDGYDEIIVGANAYNSSTGRVYIYYGGLNMNTLADVILTGEATNSNFGSSVSTAGDVNGD